MKKSSDDTKDKLISGYHAAIEQNKLYAEFRWKVFSYISTLQAGLYYLAFSIDGDEKMIICALSGITISIVLWLLEKRHHSLFTQSRNSGKLFEDALEIKEIGVFNIQKNQKEGWGHSKILFYTTIVTTSSWILLLIYEVVKILGCCFK